MEEAVIRVKVFRGGPGEKGRLEEFAVRSAQPLSVMALLAKVHDLDPTFACRTSTCFKGKCGSCLVRVNGEDVLGCVTLAAPGETVVVEPCSRFAVIRDVAVDFSRPAAGGKEAAGDEGDAEDCR